MEMTIKIYPDIGDVYKIILFVPKDVDAEEFVDIFLDENVKHVADWMWN